MSDEITLPKKVALYSTKSVYWAEVGRLNYGYNIVTREQAQKWLERDHVRIVEPEEVAKEFNY